MRIHSTAKFEGCDLPFHDCFKIQTPEQHVEEMKITIVNLAIEKLKAKCKEYFRVDFGKMISFECYYYNTEGKESNLFRKEKEK